MFTGTSIGFSLDQPKAKFRMKMRANEQNYSRNKKFLTKQYPCVKTINISQKSAYQYDQHLSD